MQADEDEWVAALVERYSVDAPQLHAEQWWQDPPAEIKYDVSGHPGRDVRGSGPFYVNGIRVVVHVPFTGEADLFKFTPNTRDWNPPTADVRSGEVLVAVEYPADSPIDVRATAQGVIDKINKYLGWARNDAEQFNRGLAQPARSVIHARRNRVREAYERAQKTGIPMRRPDESPKTYIADVLVRRPSPSIPPANVSRAIALEPVLSDEVFEHILGGKALSETVDQLFSYAGWRDTKLAVVMFVREKGLTGVVEKAREALGEHDQFVEWGQAVGETELRATMSWPGDERRHADLNLRPLTPSLTREPHAPRSRPISRPAGASACSVGMPASSPSACWSASAASFTSVATMKSVPMSGSVSPRQRRGRMRRIAYRQILIPDTVFDIERDETELLIAELRLTARTGAAYDAAGAADRLEQPNDGEPHHFADPEAHALLRALDNLHWRSQLTNRSRMLRIREVLMGTFDTKPIPYDIRFTDAATEGDGWFSSIGPYEVGDRLSTPYGDFRVVRVEHHDEGHDVLTCAPFELDTGPQTVEFSIPPHIPPTTISNRDAGRLIEEIQSHARRAPASSHCAFAEIFAATAAK